MISILSSTAGDIESYLIEALYWQMQAEMPNTFKPSRALSVHDERLKKIWRNIAECHIICAAHDLYLIKVNIGVKMLIYFGLYHQRRPVQRSEKRPPAVASSWFRCQLCLPSFDFQQKHDELVNKYRQAISTSAALYRARHATTNAIWSLYRKFHTDACWCQERRADLRNGIINWFIAWIILAAVMKSGEALKRIPMSRWHTKLIGYRNTISIRHDY